tara:strand:+ start:23 stop:259 length:237 start_codon:yes stop_codon:yes gene_type:complete
MKKTQQEIIKAANTIKNQADNLPEESSFGDCNLDEIDEYREMARQLYCAANGDLSEVNNFEVKLWLDGKPTDLDDCFS